MKFPLTLALCAAVTSVIALGIPSPAFAQDTAIVSIYRVAPGKHLAFLKWMAARESAANEAGAPATQWYRHLDGDSWDYIAIAPPHDEVLDNKADAIAQKHGMTTGMKAGLELRELMASHTDTIVAGPSSAAQLVQAAGAP